MDELQKTVDGLLLTKPDADPVAKEIEARKSLEDRVNLAIELEQIDSVVSAKKDQFTLAVQHASALKEIKKPADQQSYTDTERQAIVEQLEKRRDGLLENIQTQLNQLSATSPNKAQQAREFIDQVTRERLEHRIYLSREEQAANQKTGIARRALRRAWSCAKWPFSKHAHLRHDASEVVAYSIESAEAIKGLEVSSETESRADVVAEEVATTIEVAEGALGAIGAIRTFFANLRKKPPIFDGIEQEAAANTVAFHRQAVRGELKCVREQQEAKRESRLGQVREGLKSLFKLKWLRRKSREKTLVTSAATFARHATNVGATAAKVAGASAGAVATAPATLALGSVLSLLKAIENISEYTEDQELEKQLQQTISALGENAPELQPELESIRTMFQLRRDEKQNLAKFGTNGLTTAGFGMGATAAGVALTGGSIAALTVAAPVTISVAAAAAIAREAYARGKEYYENETHRLMQDAVTGRIGDNFAKKISSDAANANVSLDEYLFERISERDPRRTASNLLAALKHEVRALSDAEIEGRIKNDDAQADLYGVGRTEEQVQQDKSRLDGSWAASFLTMFAGLSASQVLKIADSSSAEDVYCAALIRHHLKV